MSPLAGPLASSTGDRKPRDGAVIWLLAPMTVYALPFFSFLSLLAPPSLLAGSPHAAPVLRTRAHCGCGGWL